MAKYNQVNVLYDVPTDGGNDGIIQGWRLGGGPWKERCNFCIDIFGKKREPDKWYSGILRFLRIKKPCYHCGGTCEITHYPRG